MRALRSYDGAMTNTLQDRGADFVIDWPFAVARQARISVEYLADALKKVGVEVNRFAFYESEKNHQPIEKIGSLTPEQCCAVAREMIAIGIELRDHAKKHCWCCGTPLRRGRCESCD